MAEIVATTRRAVASGQPPESPAPSSPAIVDVWSRSGSKYRLRAVVLLAVNVLLFAGVGAFAYWLRSGEFFAPAREGYRDSLWAALLGVGRADVSLGKLLIDPISVLDVPMLIPIIGLLIAALISIPILVAILYRFWSSIPFIAVVGFLAVMPWLAITLLGSCILSSVRPFRTRFRFVSALIGLVPVIVYLALAWSGTREVMVGRIDPVDAIKFVAPWVLAMVASAAVFAVVLALAKLVNYRPGAVTPLLAVMFALPVALFEVHVGRDELYYRLLEKREAAYFADVDASVDWANAARRAWERHPLPRPSLKAVQESAEQKWLFELASDLAPYRTELARHQAELAERCDWFHLYFPHSRYAANALYIKARALDRRVDLLEFRRTKWIRFYDDFPSHASKHAWRMILENCPETPLGAVAALRTAQLEARAGDVHRALRNLSDLLRRRNAAAAMAERNETAAETLFSRPAVAGLRISLDNVMLHAHRLHNLLAFNNDPLYGYDPISGPKKKSEALWFGLLDLDPRSEHYVEQLARIKAHYPKCQIEDNIEVEIIRTLPGREERIARLEDWLTRYPDRDAAPEALLYLGAEYEAAGQQEQSIATFGRLGRQYPDSFWAELAAQLSRFADQLSLAQEARP